MMELHQTVTAEYISEFGAYTESHILVEKATNSVEVKIPLSAESILAIFKANVIYLMNATKIKISEEEEFYIMKMLAQNPAQAQRELLSLLELKREEIDILSIGNYYETLFGSDKANGSQIQMIDQASEFLNIGKIQGSLIIASEEVRINRDKIARQALRHLEQVDNDK